MTTLPLRARPMRSRDPGDADKENNVTTIHPANSDSAIEEQGDPVDDTRAFRRALGQFATGVTVVTTATQDRLVGMAVNSFAAVSLDPPLISWSIRNESANRQAFTEGEHFGVSVLAEDQVDVCSVFGRPREGQFDEVPWTPSIHGDPLLDQAIAHFECTVEMTHPGGDHEVVIGRVHRYTRFEGAPLLFSQGQYRVGSDHPQLENTSAAEDLRLGDGKEGGPIFVSLLKTTERCLSDQFQEYREQLELSVAGSRIINILDDGPARVDQLASGALMGTAAIEDTLQDLVVRELATGDGSGPYALTPQGKRTRELLLASAQEFNAKLIGRIDPQDMETTRRVLMKLLTA